MTNEGRREVLKSLYESIGFFFAENSKDNDIRVLNFIKDPKLINS